MNVIRRYISSICLVLLSAIVFGKAAAATPQVRVKASLDSATLLMGQTTRLNLSVTKPEGSTGYFPLLTDSDPRPYATLFGDTIELSKSFTTDTTRLADGSTSINYHIPIQVFDSGYYHVPGIEFVTGSDTVRSNSFDLKVVPVNAKADDKISDLTDVAEPAPGSWTDKLPDWLLNYWWALLAGLVLLGVLVLLIRRILKSRKNTPKPKVIVPPYEEAMTALGQLSSKQLWQKGENEQYFIELTDILRRYLSRRFGIAAPEMTTTQFLEAVSDNAKLVKYKGELRRLLELADFIKFAKGASMPGENEEAFSIVREFVQNTRPTPEEEALAKEAAKVNGEKLAAAGKHNSRMADKRKKPHKAGKEGRR